MTIFDYFISDHLNGYMVDYHGEILDCDADNGLKIISITMTSTVLSHRADGVCFERRIIPVLFDSKESAEVFSQDLRAAIALYDTVSEFINADMPIDSLRQIGKMLYRKLADNPRVVDVLYGGSPDIYHSFCRYIKAQLFNYINGHE